MVRNDGTGVISGFTKIHLLILSNVADKPPTCPGEPMVCTRMGRMKENKGEIQMSALWWRSKTAGKKVPVESCCPKWSHLSCSRQLAGENGRVWTSLSLPCREWRWQGLKDPPRAPSPSFLIKSAEVEYFWHSSLCILAALLQDSQRFRGTARSVLDSWLSS